MEQKVNVSEVSLERIISLEKQNAQLQQQVGSLNSDKANLEKRLTENQKEVKVTTGKNKTCGNWSGNSYTEFIVESVETRNLSDIEEIVAKRYKADIEKSESEIKDLTDELDDKKREYVRSKKALEDNHKEEIKTLKDEIKKLKDNKTDEQLIAARAEEIEKLRDEIKELKKAIKDLQSLNPFRALWSRIIKRIIITDHDESCISRRTHKTVYDTLYDTWRRIKI